MPLLCGGEQLTNSIMKHVVLPFCQALSPLLKLTELCIGVPVTGPFFPPQSHGQCIHMWGTAPHKVLVPLIQIHCSRADTEKAPSPVISIRRQVPGFCVITVLSGRVPEQKI